MTRTNSPTRPPVPSAPALPRSRSRFTGVKVFSATMFAQRSQLGEAVTAWIAAHPEITIVDLPDVVQSSDAQFHCVSVCVFYRGELAAAGGGAR